MDHKLPGKASFWSFLYAIDRDLAERARQEGCPCGGRLDQAHYLRKPRGGAPEPAEGAALPAELLLQR